MLIKELQSLALDVRVLDREGEEIDLKQNFDEDDNMGLVPADSPVMEESSVEVDSELSDGYSIEHPDEDEEPEEFSEEDLDAVERAILDSGDDEDGFVDLDL